MRPTLSEIAECVPLGFECRSCGAAVYNHLKRAHIYIERGETCCSAMKAWVIRAQEIKDANRLEPHADAIKARVAEAQAELTKLEKKG